MRPSIAVPTAANLRYFRRLVWFGIGMALVAMLVATFVLSMGGGGGRRSPLPLLIMGLGLIVSSVRWRSTAARLDTQIRQLSSYGRRFPVDLVRTELMIPGFRSGGRHVVVARWQDKAGQTREALSEGFDYDPAPLLERERIEILADPFDPELCLVVPETVPPRHYRELAQERREATSRLGPRAWGYRSVPLWVPALLVLLVFAYLAWAVS
jgi:hypothetical protein